MMAMTMMMIIMIVVMIMSIMMAMMIMMMMMMMTKVMVPGFPFASSWLITWQASVAKVLEAHSSHMILGCAKKLLSCRKTTNKFAFQGLTTSGWT